MVPHFQTDILIIYTIIYTVLFNNKLLCYFKGGKYIILLQINSYRVAPLKNTYS